MNTILNLRESRAKAWEAAKNFLDTHTDNKGMMSAEDSATYDKMEAEISEYGKQIDRLERQEAIDAELNAPVNKPLRGAVDADHADTKPGRASDAYKKAFWKNFTNRGVSREVYDALQIGTDTEGGYLVPDEFEKQLVQALTEENIFRQFAHVIRTENGDHNIPVVASHGTAAWTDEEAAYNESDEAFSKVVLGANKLTTMMKVSEELMADSAFNMESYIASEFARRIGAAEEEAFISGDGSKKPTGIIASATADVTSATTAAVDVDDIMDLFYALKAPYRRNAIFLMNDSTVKALRKLKDSNGQYLWQPSVTAGTPDSLLNRPVYTSSYMPAIATGAKAVVFGDMSYYWIADRAARSFKRLNELYAVNGQVGFLGMERVDGKLVLAEAAHVMTVK